MSKYQFDCFVCDVRLETSKLPALLAFMQDHKTCGEEEAGEDRG